VVFMQVSRCCCVKVDTVDGMKKVMVCEINGCYGPPCIERRYGLLGEKGFSSSE